MVEHLDALRGKKNSPYKIGLNSVLLQRGHLPALSRVTGLVKRFMYRQSLHIHRIECSSGDWPSWVKAVAAMSRIASSAAFSVLGAESINSIPTVEVCRLISAKCASKNAVVMFSCSCEHIWPPSKPVYNKSAHSLAIRRSEFWPGFIPSQLSADLLHLCSKRFNLLF